MRRHRHAKIVATVGPASNTPERLKALFLAGVDTFRLNFSHGTHDDHAKVHAAIRALEKETGRPIGILQDLQGPKIRIGTLRGGKAELATGDRIRFVREGREGSTDAIPLPHPEIFAAVAPGQDLLIDDGRVRVRVVGVDDTAIDADVVVGGPISDRKGVNLPGTVLALSPLTEKDRRDLAFGLDLGVDWVALSFVQTPSDVMEARGLIAGRAGLIAKIEKPSALDHIEDIIRIADGVMVARGDLGVELPPEDVPGRQKELVRACRRAVKPVIVATQMLESMIEAPTPTRAEVSDVANAVYDGADAVMLSAESAAGAWPEESVAMMDRIAVQVERDEGYKARVRFLETPPDATTSDALAHACMTIADTVPISAITVFTTSGSTARRVARERPATPMLVLTPSIRTARRVALLWGAHAVATKDIGSFEEMIGKGKRMALRHKVASAGAKLIVLAGVPFGTPGATNLLHVVTVTGDELDKHRD